MKKIIRKLYEAKKRLHRKRGHEKAVSDVAREGGAHRIVLRERVLRFELSVKKGRRFFALHRRALVVVCGLAFAAWGAHLILRGFASTAVFYPSSCLGNWEGVQNALGHPDVPPGSPDADFTGANSAQLISGGAQMFCGNFTGDISPEDLEEKQFEDATLVLSWSVQFPESADVVADSSPAFMTDIGVSSGSQDVSAESNIDNNAATSLSPSDVILSPELTPPSEGADGGTESAPESTQATPQESPAGEQDPSGAGELPTGQASDTGQETGDLSAPAPEPTFEPTPPPAPPSFDAPSLPDSLPPPPAVEPEPAPTSFLRRMVSVAYAEELIADPSSTILTTAEDSLVHEWNATDTVPASISIDTSITEVAPRPQGEAGDVLNISFSTDGVNWTPLVNINKNNWREGRYEIPIHSWEELSSLQVMFVGLGASEMPKLYLDASGVEVSYGDVESVVSDTTPEADTLNEPTPPSPPPPPAASLLPAGKPASHSCEVNPFATTLNSGAGASLALALYSGFPITEETSTPSRTPLYDVVLGSMPRGVTASLGDARTSSHASTTRPIRINVSASAEKGSYNVVVLYRESQENGGIVPQYCQFNLIIE